MAGIMIHRGSSQIGGCCTEISTGESRILIDFGANLPGTDETAETKDSEMVSKVFGESRKSAVLFTHYHGDPMARNVNKLHNKIQKGKTGKHLFSLKSA